jgi:hypothetical protein
MLIDIDRINSLHLFYLLTVLRRFQLKAYA